MKKRLFGVFLVASVVVCCFCLNSFIAIAGQASATAGAAAGDCVNINSSSADQLQQLPGIGPATAKSIVHFREQNGPFAAVEDLKKVKGIGDKKFNKIKDLVCI